MDGILQGAMDGGAINEPKDGEDGVIGCLTMLNMMASWATSECT